MKNYVKTLYLVVSLLGPSMVSAQSRLERLDEDRRILLNTVGDDLDIFAQEKGYLLDKTSLRLSYPWSNLVGVAVAVVGVAVGVGVPAGVPAGVAVGVPVGVGVGVGVAVRADEDRYFHHKMLIVNHYRSKVSFSLIYDEGRKVRTESCILFYSIEEGIREIDYEIDNCSNDDIFPQNEEGFLRVGTHTDWFERHVSDQDDVVVNGTLPL